MTVCLGVLWKRYCTDETPQSHKHIITCMLLGIVCSGLVVGFATTYKLSVAVWATFLGEERCLSLAL